MHFYQSKNNTLGATIFTCVAMSYYHNRTLFATILWLSKRVYVLFRKYSGQHGASFGSTKYKTPPHRGWCFVFKDRKEGNRTNLNATVRWTVARCGLDRIYTMINSIPLGSTKKKTTSRGAVFFFWYGIHRGVSNRSKCNSPVDCCSMRA